ncbi:MAG: LCP family protein [Bifidobacteriaceae bacterium]|nr:LCP family protein [Bifidobacteriaceae bacterium]
MQVRHAAPTGDRPSRHRRKVTARHRALKVIATGLVATLLAAFAAVGERIRQLDANLKSLDITELISHTQAPTERAPEATTAAPLDPFGGKAVNILITAIDSRAGANHDVVSDTVGSLLNDVNMVAHISADRSRVDILSIPRDTLVTMPACQRPDGSMAGEDSSRMINEAFAKGAAGDPEMRAEGAACVFLTMQAVTGIKLDGFIMVEFAGFASVVDALGGIDVCVPEGLIGSKTDIDLTPGVHHLDGVLALAFARTRSGKTYTSGYLTGSDTDRINRQQQLIATVVHKVRASGDLTSLPRLNSVATAVTTSLYLNPELASVTKLAGLAYALRDIDMDHVSLFTPPWYDDPYQQYRVRLSESGVEGRFGGYGAPQIFEAIALDQPIPGTAPYKLAHNEPGDQSVEADEDFTTPLSAVPATCAVAGQGDNG